MRRGIGGERIEMEESMLNQMTVDGFPVGLAILAAIVFVPVIWFIVTLNRFIRLKNLIHESWSNVDVVLRRRYDLIPNLVESVKGYAQHERSTFEAVISARNRAAANHGRIRDQADDENELVHCTNQLLALAERYPDLKASENFLQLQRELVNTEDRIAAARRFYNANVREHNTLVQQFPSMIVARLMSRREEDFFEVEDLAVRATPQVQFS